MTLVEILFVLPGFVAAYYSAKLGFRLLWIPGGVVGAVVGFAAWIAMLELFGRFLDALDYVIHPRPVCPKGRCRWRQYEFQGLHEVGPGLSDLAGIWECGCGDRFLSWGARFSVLARDGTLIPYQRRSLGRWKPDDGVPPKPPAP